MTVGARQSEILLVEDDPADQLMVRRALEGSSLGARLAIANDGEEALDYLERSTARSGSDTGVHRPPDLVLVDLNMPKVDGREFVRSARANPRFKSLPILALTTSFEPADIAQMYELGASSYIVKPVGIEELRRVLEAIQEYWFRVVELPPAR